MPNISFETLHAAIRDTNSVSGQTCSSIWYMNKDYIQLLLIEVSIHGVAGLAATHPELIPTNKDRLEKTHCLVGRVYDDLFPR